MTEKKINELTPTQFKRMREITEEWINRATKGSCANISTKDLKKNIDWLYNHAGLKKPQVVVMPNLTKYKMAGHIATQLGYKTIDEKDIYAKFVTMVDDVEKQLYAKITNEIGSKCWVETKEKMETSVLTNMLNPLQRAITNMNEVEKSAMKKIFEETKDEFFEQTGKKRGKSAVEYGLSNLEYYFGLAHDTHLPFYQFALEEGWMKNDAWDEYIKIYKNGYFTMMFFDELAIVCRLPKQVKRNPAGFLHDTEGYALTWADGTGHNFIRGVYFGEEMFDQVIHHKISAKDLLQIKNIEQRYAAIQVYDIDRLIKEMNGVLLDREDRKNHENKPYFIELYALEGVIPNRTLKLLKYSDPSTKRVYPSFVPDATKTAIEGMAFKFKLKPKEYVEQLKREA